MITPGRAPTYVRRCPLTSASSRTPPKEILSNLRPKLSAIDFPIYSKLVSFWIQEIKWINQSLSVQ